MNFETTRPAAGAKARLLPTLDYAAIADGIFVSVYGRPLEACIAVRRFVAVLCVHSARIPPFPDRTSAVLHCSYLRQVRTKGMVQWRLLFTNT